MSNGQQQVMRAAETYLPQLQQRNGTVPPWLRRIREEGINRFAELGFPTTQMEDWKYTNVAPIANVPFQLPGAVAASARLAEHVHLLRGRASNTLVFVNGRYAAELSSLRALPAGAKIGSLAAALEAEGPLVEPHLGRYASPTQQSFTALNAAFLDDGALVYLAKGTDVTEPIHVLFVSTAPGQPTIACPRNLIVAEEHSRVTVVESYVGVDGGSYFTNAVTEIAVGPRAQVDHYRLQREAEEAFHVATIQVRQDAASHFASHSISLGGALVRTDINIVLDAEGCECELDGLYVARGTQHVDHHTMIDHKKPRGTSRELYKGILDGRATGVFNGKVFVRPNAQKSDAQQVNRNLLLSDDAVMNTKPQLEIFADDVKCSHGATIGRLDDEALFYLRSRGIGETSARQLLTYAFASELIGRIKVEPIRVQLDQILWSRLHGTGPEA